MLNNQVIKTIVHWISLMKEQAMACWVPPLKILKILTKTMVSISAEVHQQVEITKVLHSILFQMIIINQQLLNKNPLSKKSLNLFQIQYSWAKWMLLNSKCIIKWPMESKIKWLMLITIKVECLNSNNTVQPWQDMVNHNNNSVECLNKTNSKLDIIKIKDSADSHNTTRLR